MKICFVTEYFPTGSSCDIRGGAEAVAFYEAKYLSGSHEITVITSCERGFSREDQFENIKVIRCGKTREYAQLNAFTDRFSFMRSAYLYGIRQQYDLVIGFSIITYPVAWKISKKLKIPCIIRYHDVLAGRWIRNFGPMGVIGEILERYTLSRKFAAIIAVSDYTACNLKKFVPGDVKLYVIPNGVDVSEKFIPKAQQPTVVCVSRLVKYKHVDDLIKAVMLLVKDFPDLQCKIAGSGPEHEKLRNLARQQGISQHITFSGFVKDHDEVLDMMRTAHVFCLPSCLEGFGIVIMESMACGVPFVAAEIPAVREASGGKGGLFYTCRDVENLTKKIMILLRDTDLSERLTEEGRQRAVEFQWREISPKAGAIYEKIVSEWERSC